MDRDSLLLDLKFLQQNNDPLVVQYLAKKYHIATTKATQIEDYILQYTGGSNPPITNLYVTSILETSFKPALYTGLWYLAGRIPQAFDRNTAWETAEYSILNNNLIKVVNTGYNEDNTIKGQITGTAEIVGPSALYVSFPTGMSKVLGKIANYLII
jgi:lipocalin